MIDGNSVRDEVKDAIRNDLAGYAKMDISEVDADLVGVLADSVFDALAIDEEDQDRIRERGCFVWLQGIHNSLEAGGGGMTMNDTRKRRADIYWKGKSKCTCGHLGDGTPSDHLDRLQAGHGPCTVQGCGCQQFSWAAWTEEFEAFLELGLDQRQLFKDEGVLI